MILRAKYPNFHHRCRSLSWVAENAEGLSDDIRAELLQLVDQSDFAAFWELLGENTDDNGYAIQSHTLELQPNFSVI